MPAVSPIRRHTPSMLIAVVVLAVLFAGAVTVVLFLNADQTSMTADNSRLEKESGQRKKDIAKLKAEISDLKSGIGEDVTLSMDKIRTNFKAKLLDYLQPIPTWDDNGPAMVATLEGQIRANQNALPNVINVLKRLRAWVNQSSKEIKSLEAKEAKIAGDKAGLQKDYDALEASKKVLNSTLGDTIRKLEDDKSTLQTRHATDYKEMETNLRGELKNVDDENRRLERQIKAAQIKILDLESRNKILLHQIKVLTTPVTPEDDPTSTAGPTPVTGARHTADGKIILADVSRGVVYLDLGSRDRVPLGMQFRVYSASEKNLDPIKEGKGLIEVTKVGLTLSECRIVQKGEGDLVKGDVVVNPVYARGKRMKFFVFGSFDLDSDGRADARGLERMKQLIAKWGGEVVGKINVNTDYGVMGMEPELPSKPGPDADPITQQQYKNKKAKYDQYKQQLANLRGLSIPVLNQNRFLSFIGYYESQASH